MYVTHVNGCIHTTAIKTFRKNKLLKLNGQVLW